MKKKAEVAFVELVLFIAAMLVYQVNIFGERDIDLLVKKMLDFTKANDEE